MAIIDKPSDFFNTVLYTGNGSNRNITGVGHSPDFTWLKARSESEYHFLYDIIRGATKGLSCDLTAAEATYSDGLTAFASDGFSLGTSNGINRNNTTYVSWNWKAGTSFTNDASSTGIGTIDSTGSASDTSGFSIVSYTGTGSAGTIKHGLSTAPLITLIKSTTTSTNWNFLTYQIDGSCDELALNLSSEGKTDRSITAPTSSVFSVDTAADRNGSGVNFIAYCFAERKGFSKFGTYVANGGGADSTFVYLGFKPAWIMVRKSSGAQSWYIGDNKRLGYNPKNENVNADTSGAEFSQDNWDVLSNGFKIKNNGAGVGTTGDTYIYMAFAEEPLVASNFNPATAR